MSRIVASWLCIAGCDRSVPATALPPSAARQRMELGAGDVLEIRVRDQEDISGVYQVGEGGSIRFPWIGEVDVRRRPLPAIAEEIEARLADGWLRNAQVVVLVHERQNREVSVLGQVKEPGSYEYKEGMQILQAVSLAGGMNPLAMPRRAKLIRETDAGRQTFEIDLTQILESRAADVELEPGDIVFIPESPI